MNQQQHLHIDVQGVLGIISLDRSTHLNALNLPMIEGIRAQLAQWRHDQNIQAIVINSNSDKAFCAGGDIRFIYDSYQAGNQQDQQFFRTEYAMLNELRDYPKTVIALLDGYVLGGGFGLAQACHIRVSSEKSRFAMPETAIGFFPDVGATYFLSRLDEIGVYLALTGAQISSSDALSLDLIDYHVPSADLTALQQALCAAPQLNHTEITRIIAQFITHPSSSELQKQVAEIDQHFAYATIEQIEQSLADQSQTQDALWAKNVLQILQQRPMLAKKVSLKLQQVGQSLSLEKSMQLEQNLQAIWADQGDFMEGVRALIVDKDKNPHWQTDNQQFEQILASLWSA